MARVSREQHLILARAGDKEFAVRQVPSIADPGVQGNSVTTGLTFAAFEGFYGFGSGNLDIGLRGGFLSPGEASDTRILVGVHARQRVITPSDNFPVDGAAVLGIGAQLVSGSSQLLIPGGLSLGRRLVLEDSEVSILPYVQPTLFLAFNDGTDVLFAFGLGGDFRLSRVLEVRISVGLGDVDGVALSAVWMH